MSGGGQADLRNASPALLSPQDAALAEWRPRLCGLLNLGGSSFMNATLQCLLHTTELSNFFLRGLHKKDMNVDNALGCKGKLAESFHLFLEQTHSHSASCADQREQGKCVPVDSSVSPHYISRCVSDFSSCTECQDFVTKPDSHELIAFLLDGLHEDLNRVKRKPLTLNVLGDGSDDANDAREGWERYKMRNDFIVKRGVRSAVANATTCQSSLSHLRTCLLRSKGRERMALCLPVLRACLKPTSNQSDTMAAGGGGLYVHNATMLQQYVLVANACEELHFVSFIFII